MIGSKIQSIKQSALMDSNVLFSFAILEKLNYQISNNETYDGDNFAKLTFFIN